MGRVHKKKLAEYAEAAENEELNKSNEEGGGGGDADASAEEAMHKSSAAADDGDILSSNDETDAEDEITLALAAKKAPELGGDLDDAAEDDDEFQSLHGDADAGEPEKNGKKGAPKRKTTEKAAAKFAADDDEDDAVDDESLNGASPPKRGRKAAAGKAKAVTPKGKAAAAGRGRPKVAAKKPEPTAEESEEEEEYEVKDIVDHKTERGVSYFLIRWKGYTKADDTWEPELELSCPEIIEKYKKKQPASAGKSPKKAAASPAKKGRPGAKAKEDPEKEWEVEKIIDYAQEKSGRVFRIRWKGFGPKFDTWEPEENLYCDDIIKKFMSRMKSQENVSFKELREGPKKPRRLVNETAPRTNYHNAIGRKSKRGTTKKRVYYGDSDD